MVSTKPHLTISQQIDLLKNRNLIINDEEYAAEQLSSLNYYRLSGYTLTLSKNNRFRSGTRFEDILDIYNCDLEIRSLLWKYLSRIEISLRSHIGYLVGEKDPLGLTKREFFRSDLYYEKFQKDIQEGISNNKSEVFVIHHNKKYNGVMPSWVMVELLSFGDLSFLFSGLEKDLKKELVKEYYPGCAFNYLENWFEGLVILRNFCAHHKRLYNRGFPNTPTLTDSEFGYYRECGYHDSEIGKRLFFRIAIICRLLVTADEQNSFIGELDAILKNHDTVDIKRYGLQHDWKEMILFINERFFVK